MLENVKSMLSSTIYLGVPFTVLVGVLSASAAHATINVDFTGQTGNAAARDFTSGNITLTFKPSSSSPMTSVSSSENGLCLFSSSTNSTSRCGLPGGTVISPSVYNFIEFTSNTPLVFTGGNVKVVNGVIDPTQVKFDFNGSSLAAIPGSIGDFTFTSPVTIQAGQTVLLSASGSSESSIRVQSFSFEEVPGPLPLLGAGAAFAWSRRLRKKTYAL